jgi:hypothetical protein
LTRDSFIRYYTRNEIINRYGTGSLAS